MKTPDSSATLSPGVVSPPPAKSVFSKGPVTILALATVVCLAPFVGKAFHIDDPLFLWTAKQIHAKPWDFYGFHVNWYGYDMPMTGATENPPLAAYFIAVVTAVLGWGESGLHLAFLLPAIGVVLGTYYLARRLCSQPLFAALLALLSPGFLLCSTSVMSDTLMVCFWVWAIFFWLRGLEAPKASFLLLSALLISCCELTKFFGLSLIPLLAAYSLFRRRPLREWVWGLVIPVAVLVLYQWHTSRLYGQGGFSFAAGFSLKSGAEQPVGFLSGLITALAFTGGSMIVVLFCMPWLRSGRWLFGMAGFTLVLLLPTLESEHIGFLSLNSGTGFRWGTLVQAAVFVFCGLGLLWLAFHEAWFRRSPEALLLGLWVLGTFVFAWKVNWTVSGRSLLPIVPAVSILVVRRLQAGREGAGLPKSGLLVLPLIPAAGIALLVSWSDYRLANASREAAAVICKDFGQGPHTLLFQGHWGFQYYMEQKGAKAIDFKQATLTPGTCMASPAMGANTGDLGRIAKESKAYAWSTCRLLTPFNMEAGAGYHASLVGPLPYALVWRQTEVFSVYEATNLLRIVDGTVLPDTAQ